MSETTTAPARPAARGQGKKYAGLTRNQWLITGGVFVAVLGYLLWKRRQSAAASTAATGATNQGSNECTDANGNPVDCNQAFASELADMQNALDQLAAQGGGSGGASGATGSANGSGTGTTDGTGTGTTTTTQPAGTPTTSTGGGTATAAKAGLITGLKASNVTKTSFKASWNAAPNASGGYAWIVRNLATHKDATSGKTNSTSVTVSGLQSGTDYNFGVQGLPGGVGDNVHVRTK